MEERSPDCSFDPVLYLFNLGRRGTFFLGAMLIAVLIGGLLATL